MSIEKKKKKNLNAKYVCMKSSKDSKTVFIFIVA